MAQSDIDRINETINNVADTVNAVIDTTRRAILNSSKRQKPTLYRKMDGELKGGNAQKVLGGILTGVGAFMALLNIPGIFNGAGGAAGAVMNFVVAAVMAAVGLSNIIGGNKKTGRVKRFNSYLEALGTKTYVTLEVLSEYTGKSVRFIVEDLQDMIARKMFLQGHLDDQKTSLITSDETYKDYRRAAAIQKVKAEQEMVKAESLKGLSPEARDIVRRGEDYIMKIQQINAELPGEVITLKLQKLESVIRRILEEAKEKPENIMDLRKLMNYYLPTTLKLVGAYEEFDTLSEQGPDIMEAKVEIEKTLDAINAGFAELLNKLFRETAYDVTTDARVLQTMLAKEGLTADKELEKVLR